MITKKAVEQPQLPNPWQDAEASTRTREEGDISGQPVLAAVESVGIPANLESIAITNRYQS